MAAPEYYPGQEEGRDAKRCIDGDHDDGNVCGGYKFPDFRVKECRAPGPSIFDTLRTTTSPSITLGPLTKEIEKWDPSLETVAEEMVNHPGSPVQDKRHAYTFLEEAVSQMKDRAVQRDTSNGGKAERSMASTVKAFNALTGHNLTEEEGWEFMILLKLVRGRQGKFRADDYVDAAAYSGLLGECASGSR